MTSGPTDKGDDGSVDVEAAWADIVAHWDDPAGPSTQDRHPAPSAPADQDDQDDQDSGEPGGGTRARTVPPAGPTAQTGDRADDQAGPHPAPHATAPTGDSDDGGADGPDTDDWDRPRSRVGGEQARLSAAREAELEAALGDDRYHPPEPPPLPRGDTVSRLAWAGVLGAPLFFLLAALFWRSAPVVVVIGAVLAFVAGFATLVVRMPDRDDDPDDGAVV